MLFRSNLGQPTTCGLGLLPLLRKQCTHPPTHPRYRTSAAGRGQRVRGGGGAAALLQELRMQPPKGFCRLGEVLCSQWPHSPGHTHSIPRAPAVWPRIAGIPGEETSSPSLLLLLQPVSAFILASSSLVLLPPLHTCQCLNCTHTDLSKQFPGERRMVWQGSSLPSPGALLALCLSFFSVQWGDWPLTGLGFKALVLHCPREVRETAPCQPSLFDLNPGRGKRVPSFLLLPKATLPPPQGTDTLIRGFIE